MGTRGIRVQSTDGIIEDNVEYTLDNFATLSTHGTSDKVILDLMLNNISPKRSNLSGGIRLPEKSCAKTCIPCREEKGYYL